MKNLEAVFDKVNKLIIEELPKELERIDKAFNDGLITEHFNNKNIDEKCNVYPCFECEIKEIDQTEKDRIIETTRLEILFNLKFNPNTDKLKRKLFRYQAAFGNVFNDNKTEHWNHRFLPMTLLTQVRLVLEIE